MDVLWSPWRHDDIKTSDAPAALNSTGCVFCDILKSPASDEEKFILHRAGHNSVILNAFPYISGYLMVVPYKHLADLDCADKKTTDELMDLAKRCQTALREVYSPHGFNMEMNFGKAGGAGVAEHFHLHFLLRWTGDVNFMTSIGATRAIPESLQTTYASLKDKF
ncbi:MAG TPA: HIT domain-containing protein [Pyrinomonadaceae bacterium]|nr:HIT domain-containing protein [Pyrinomonadaceae bacterium]